MDKGQPIGDPIGEEIDHTDKVDQVVSIGTHIITPENNYSKNVEVNTKFVYDDTLPIGHVKTGELIPGKIETKVSNKYNRESNKVEQTIKEIVTAANQKIIVGTSLNGISAHIRREIYPKIEFYYDDTKDKGIVEEGELTPGKVESLIYPEIIDGKIKLYDNTESIPSKQIIIVGIK